MANYLSVGMPTSKISAKVENDPTTLVRLTIRIGDNPIKLVIDAFSLADLDPIADAIYHAKMDAMAEAEGG